MKKIKKTTIYSVGVIGFMYFLFSSSLLKIISLTWDSFIYSNKEKILNLIKIGIQTPAHLFLLILIIKYSLMYKNYMKLIR